MKKVLFTSCLVLIAILANAQTLSYNPFVNAGIVSPAPLLPLEFNGTGVLTFNVGNTGSTSLALVTDQEMTLVITLSDGEPNNANPIAALGGTALAWFNWSYNAGLKTYTAVQNQAIPGSSIATITIQYKVTNNTPFTVSSNGFNVNLQPPPYTNSYNSTDDDQVSSYTYVKAVDFGDAPVSYGLASHEINLFKNQAGQYENYMFMGNLVDAEPAYQASALADGDDLTGIPDDEDGVTFPPMITGTTVTIPVSITIIGGESGALNAWIDWNGDGDFLDAGEKLTPSPITLYVTQVASITANIPSGANTSSPTFARFRLGTNVNHADPSIRGEVEDYRVTLISSQPSILLAKTGTYQDFNSDGRYSAGDRINYTFRVENNGNATLTGVVVTDANPAVVITGAAIGTMEPGTSVTKNGYYTLTQTDINAGTFTNTATATGYVGATPYSDPDDDVQALTQLPDIDLVKTGSLNLNVVAPNGRADVGDKILYTFLVENTGNTTLTNVLVTDANPNVTITGAAIGTMQPGAVVNLTGSYTLTQADINAGTFTNTATVTGYLGTTPYTDTDGDTRTITAAPAIDLIKTGVLNTNIVAPNGVANAGDVINYTFRVQNTGNTTLTNVSVTEPNANVTLTGNPIGTMLPGAVVTLTGTYTLTQTDINSGTFSNTASVAGTFKEQQYTDSDGDTQTLTQNPAVLADKVLKDINGNPLTTQFSAAGDQINYLITLANTGNVTVYNPVITDANADAGSILYVSGDANTNGVLDVGETWTYNARHTVTPADLTLGKVVNTAVGSGMADLNGDGQGETPVSDNSPTFTVFAVGLVDLSITKTVYNAVPAVGESSFFTVRVTNNSQTLTATGVVVTDLLDPAFLFQSYNASQGQYDQGTGFWTVGSLTPGSSATLAITVTVLASGDNVASITYSDQEDGNPGNNVATVSVTVNGTSGGNDGGIESNGNLAGKIAIRNHDRMKEGTRKAYQSAEKLQNYSLQLAAEGVIKPASVLKNQTNLISFLPETGPFKSKPFVSTPDDLLGISNAKEVVALDYFGADDRRYAAILAITTDHGEVYNHTKLICDRLVGARLEKEMNVTIQDKSFIMTKLVQENGEVDYAVSFIAFAGGGSLSVDSRWSNEEYSPAEGSMIHNFQVWSVTVQSTIDLVNEVLARMESRSQVKYLNTKERKIPVVTVVSGEYRRGNLHLTMKNPQGAAQVNIKGNFTRTELSDREQFEYSYTLDPSRTFQEIDIPIGLIFDAGFSVANNVDPVRDVLYFADGPWGLDYQESGAVITDYTISSEPAKAGPDDLPLERNVTFSARVKDYASIFRAMRAGNRSINATAWNALEFEATGNVPVEVVITRRSFNNWSEQYRSIVYLQASEKTFTIEFDKLVSQASSRRFNAEDVESVVFSAIGNGSAYTDVRINLKNLRFTNRQSDPAILSLENYRLTNYPNPFAFQTFIEFELPEKGKVTLTVYDVAGREVERITDREFNKGRNVIKWENNYTIRTGAYLLKMMYNGEQATHVMLMK